MQPKISLIIPVYNVQDYITQCLESVKNLSDTEIIIIDDASTDNSIAIARSILPDAVYLTHATNKGLSEARNTGIHAATGQYIQLLDADDFLLTPTRLIHRPEPKGDVTIINYMIYDGERLIVRKRQAWNAGWRHIVRREWLLANNLFFESGLLMEDIRWVHDLYQAEPTIHRTYIPAIAYRNQRHDSIMNTPDPQKIAQRLIHLNQTVRYCKSPRVWWLMFLYIKDYNGLPTLRQSYKGLYPRWLLWPTHHILRLVKSLLQFKNTLRLSRL